MTPRQLPLRGKKILITRAKEQSSVLARLLKKNGATVLECPLIRIESLKKTLVLDRALRAIPSFSWIVFTSANAVSYFYRRAKQLKIPRAELTRPGYLAIGPATKKAIVALGLPRPCVAKQAVAESVLESLGNTTGKILIPRALKARDLIPQELRQRKRDVLVAPCYQTVLEERSRIKLKKWLQEEIDAITFTSSSTVENFFRMAGRRAKVITRLRQTCIASIGPITTQTLREFSLEPQVQADPSTIVHLTKSLIRYFQGESHESK